MSKFEKLVAKIFGGNNISYQEAENVLLHLGFQLKINGLIMSLENLATIGPFLLRKGRN